jgi:RNA polymerase sigma-70 factor (ECF subfamily)
MVLSSLLLAAAPPPGAGDEPGGTGRAAGAPAFEALYDEHAPFVWRAVRRLGVPEASAADVVQETFLVVHRRLSEYRERTSARAWLYAIAVRVARDYRRSVRRKSPAQLQAGGPGDPEGLVDTARPDPLASAERAQAMRLLHDLLARLDDERREVLVLAELEQLTGPEIAEALGVNVNTVAWRLRTARRELQAALDRHLAQQRRVER